MADEEPPLVANMSSHINSVSIGDGEEKEAEADANVDVVFENDNQNEGNEENVKSNDTADVNQAKAARIDETPRTPIASITSRMRTVDLDDPDFNLDEIKEDSTVGPPPATSRYKHVAIEINKGDGKVYFCEHPSLADGKRHIVFVEMKITRISEINTSNETFRCTFHMFFTWLASLDEVKSYNEHKKLAKSGQKEAWTPNWEPVIVFMNSNGISNVWKKNVPYSIHTTQGRSALQISNWGMREKHLGFDPQLGHWIHGMWQGDFDLTEEMELESFPFDCQDFTINIRSVIGADKCDLVPMPRRASADGGSGIVPIQFFSKDSVVDEWQFVNLLCEFRLSNPKHSRSQKTYPKIMVQIKAQRTFEAYIGLIIVTFALFWMGLGAFSIDVDEGGERLGFCITLLLAEVVNIQWAFNTLPNVPYLTIIERYIYASFVFLFIVTSYSCLVCGILHNDVGEWFGTSIQNVDEGFGWFFLAANCAIQTYFYIHSKNARQDERKHLMAQTIAYRKRKHSSIAQTVDLPIAFDENTIHNCALHGQKRFSGLALSSRTKKQLEKQF